MARDCAMINNLKKTGYWCITLLTWLGMVYLYEKSIPVSSYFTYYGYVSKRNIVHFPERLESYSFGSANNEPLVMHFHNKLWCTEIGTDETPQLIAERKVERPNYTFDNTIPTYIITTPEETRAKLSQIGLLDANLIRKEFANAHAWNMGEIRPYADSLCFISAKATTYSKLFNIPKSTSFNGNWFIYSTNLRPSEYTVEDSPYTVWLRKQLPDYMPFDTLIEK